MNLRYTPAVLAILALGSAHAEDGPSFSFSGFGTLAAVHSSERKADFTGSAIQPNGAGYTDNISFGPDSKIGAQANAKWGDWSGVLQLVSQHQYDNTWIPAIEWANISYQLTPEIRVRVGRTSVASFTQSETRLVGYAQTFVRPPLEVYGLSPFTSSNGIDVSYRRAFGNFNNTLQLAYGKDSIKLSRGVVIDADSTVVVADTFETGPWSARFSYVGTKVTLNASGTDTLLASLQKFTATASAVPVPAFQTAAAQSSALYDQYRSDEIRTTIFSVGATYDPGDWFVTGEWASEKFGRGFLSDSNAWYVGGGYRYSNFTPYGFYSSAKPKGKPEPVITTTGAPPLAASAAALTGGVKAAVAQFYNSQSTVAVGVRWDFRANMALKAQFDHLSLGDGSSGRLRNQQPGYVQGGSANLVTVALDFVF